MKRTDIYIYHLTFTVKISFTKISVHTKACIVN